MIKKSHVAAKDPLTAMLSATQKVPDVKMKAPETIGEWHKNEGLNCVTDASAWGVR